ncbi:phenylalanine transporter [Klebsiella pneumoniae]|uniref:Phenylalanine transporter n=1 Tax=Klebsiella pneumoniae TaxID=573 RepID=A0A378F9C2_KLEPN|nr:phenylalanine transporter [Klebsiella pneumoniae]
MKDASTSSETVTESGPTLHRGLQNRHIQLIALGGAIGTGLFLGIGPAIQMAGPAVLLGYAVAGIVAFLIMRQLGEMVVEEPVSGSFAHFAYKYWGPFAGFLSGWNYWVMFVLVGMAELTAAGIYMQYWLPDVPTWVWAAAFFIIINAVNLVNVRLYGEAEFWFALIKVLAIIGMIAFGLWMLFGGHGGSKAGFGNLWKHGGFLATGWHGLILSLAVIHVLLRRAGAYRHHRRRSAKPGKEHSQSGQSGGLSYPAVLYRFGWWCCWRSTRGWRSNPTAARL